MRDERTIRLPEKDLSILRLTVKREVFALLEYGAQRFAYLPATKYWHKKLHLWDSRVNANTGPAVEFRCDFPKDAPRIAFWCMGLDTESGLKCYAYQDAKDETELLRINEPREAHFLIELGGRIEIVGGAR